MANERQYLITILGTPDTIRVRFTTERDRVLAFTVQFEPWIEVAYRPAVRIDSQHERPHRDILGWDGSTVRKDWDWEGADLPLNDALDQAISDIKRNRIAYRAAFIRRKP